MPFKPGKEWNGNKNGPPRKPEIQLLRDALEAARAKHGKHLIEHAIEKAYTDHNVLIAILKKILPDKVEGVGFNDTHIIMIGERKEKTGNTCREIPIIIPEKQ